MLKGIVLTGLITIGGYMWWDPGCIGLRVTNINLEGLHALQGAEFDSVFSRFSQAAMSKQTCTDIENAAQSVPLVSHAEARRVGLTTVVVSIQEKRIVARIDGETTMGIDSDGIKHTDIAADTSLPVLSGWKEHSAAWSSVVSLLVRLSDIHYLQNAHIPAPPENYSLKVVIGSPAMELILPCPADPHLEDRIAYLGTILADMRNRGEKPVYADLRWWNQVVVMPAQSEELS